jgi:aldehyde dehydrogenase (NAD+)
VIRGFYGDNPRSSPDLARIVDVRHHARLTGLIASSGGTIACGGEGDEASRYLAPTVIVDPDLDAPIMNEEIFGPVLPIVSVASVDEAISFVTARPKPLALYVFSKSSELVDRVLARTSSGGVAVNHALVHILPETLPFGGVGASGMGAYHGRVGFDAFSHRKSVLRKGVKPDPSLLYPPYTDRAMKILRRLL